MRLGTWFWSLYSHTETPMEQDPAQGGYSLGRVWSLAISSSASMELGCLHGCLAPRTFSETLDNFSNVKITTVYRRRQNTNPNTFRK